MRVLQVINTDKYEKELLFGSTTVDGVVYDNKVYDKEALKQNLIARCSILLGELPYNKDFGIPLKLDTDSTTLTIKDMILSTDGVTNCTLIKTEFDNKKRKLISTFSIDTVFGNINVNI